MLRWMMGIKRIEKIRMENKSNGRCGKQKRENKRRETVMIKPCMWRKRHTMMS